MYRQGSRADLSQGVAGQGGRGPTVLQPPGLAWGERARATQRETPGTDAPGLATECQERLDAATRMDHCLRRLSAVLSLGAVVLTLAAANTAVGQDYHCLGINLLLIPAALLVVVAAWRLP